MVIRYPDKVHPNDWDISANCTQFFFFFLIKNVWYLVKLFRLDCNALIRYIFYAFFKALYAVIHFVNCWIENNAEQGLTHSLCINFAKVWKMFLYMDISVKTTSDVLMHTHSVAV